MEARLSGVVFERAGRIVLEVPELVIRGDRTTALLGPNGAGKSTLLRLVAGLERPTAGSVAIDGVEAGRAEARSRVAYGFQQAVFVSGTVEGNLHLALELRGLPRNERRIRATEAAAACGIASLLSRRANSLSGGEAQRTNLARVLALRAPLTLLDEPLAGLDGPARRQLLADLPGLLRRFTATTVLVTHEADEALRLSDDVVVLDEGRILAAGPTREVLSRPPNEETAAFLGWDLVPSKGETVGFAPGALTVGEGDVGLTLAVERVADLGTRIEVEGWVAGCRVVASLREGESSPQPGARVQVGAPQRSVVRFGRPGGRASGGADPPH
jgi:ABC-type sugar transport system ATPase subunit